MRLRKNYRRKAPGLRKRRIYRRRAGYSTRRPKHGGMYLKRRVGLIRVYGSGVAGGLTVPAQNTFAVGTPVAVAGLTNIYDVPFSFQARLDELEAYTEITALFDQYKITSLKAKVQSTLTTGTQNATVVPYIEYVTDHDDSIPPTITQMRQKMGSKVKFFNSAHPYVTMFCRPRAQVQLNDGLVSAFSPAQRATWINSSNPTQAHFGIKGIIRNVAISATAGTSPFIIDVELGVALKDIQ